MERLDKLLASTGRWSRREVKGLVRAGRVLVDGVPAAAPEQKLDPALSQVLVDGEAAARNYPRRAGPTTAIILPSPIRAIFSLSIPLLPSLGHMLFLR